MYRQAEGCALPQANCCLSGMPPRPLDRLCDRATSKKINHLFILTRCHDPDMGHRMVVIFEAWQTRYLVSEPIPPLRGSEKVPARSSWAVSQAVRCKEVAGMTPIPHGEAV
jgi:hypothetical protein